MLIDKKLKLYIFAICFSLPAALFIKFLGENRYPLLTVETALLFFILAIFSLVVVSISSFSRNTALFIIGTVIFAYFYEITPFLEKFICFFEQWTVRTITGIIIVLVISAFSRRLKLSDWIYFGIAAFLTLSATTIEAYLKITRDNKVRYEKNNLVHNKGLKPVLFIIFDEHMSIEGIPENISGAGILKQEMAEFYERFNFLYFPRAYSHFFESSLSIPNALNFTANPAIRYLEKSGLRTKRLLMNRAFDFLKNRGYVFRIYQSDYIDFFDRSNEKIEYCFQYYSGIEEIHKQDFKILDKSLLLMGHFLSAIKTGEKSVATVGFLVSLIVGDRINDIPIIGAPYDRLGPIRTIPAIEQLKKDTNHLKSGTVYFAHLLTPHHPFVYDELNNLKKDPRDWFGPNRWFNMYIYKRDLAYEESYESYCKQLRGMYNWLNEWFNQLSERKEFNDLIIIVLGDHGSRITEEDPDNASVLKNPKWDSIAKDSFSVLFAVKGSQFEKGRVDIAKPLERLLFECFFYPQKLKVESSDENYLTLNLLNNKLLKVKYDNW
ncbi:MAG: hypothetical protein HY810_03785 [Candidatus Omnitrophica bacterium]|nr:hypothetical protein [Candidatus Omnitrophota bacterium]